MNTLDLWLLYADEDLAQNRDFAALMARRGAEHGLNIEAVTLSELSLGINANGTPFCIRGGKRVKPDAVLSRQRKFLVSWHFEQMGIRVFNRARACLYCNDKRLTHQLLCGIPMAETLFVPSWMSEPSEGAEYPLIVKPADGHGGESVTLVKNAEEWREAVRRIRPRAVLSQKVVSGAGRDLRVYVLFGQIVAGVMRTAREGVVSNFKLGGDVRLHELTKAEHSLAESVMKRFTEAGAGLDFAGIDMLYEGGVPIVGEVEDVVGSRMLYKVSDIDIVDMYLLRVAEELRQSRGLNPHF